MFLVGYILIKGVPNLTPSLFSLKYTSENVSLLPALVNTLFMTALSLLFAVPVGIGSAVYLTEYAKRGNRFVGVVRITAETLSGIPSIVYGLFGSLFFVITLKFGLSLMSERLYARHYDPAAHHADNGRGHNSRAGCFPRGGATASARADSGQCLKSFFPTAVRGHNLRRHSGHRAHRRRIGGAHIYGGHCSGDRRKRL